MTSSTPLPSGVRGSRRTSRPEALRTQLQATNRSVLRFQTIHSFLQTHLRDVGGCIVVPPVERLRLQVVRAQYAQAFLVPLAEEAPPLHQLCIRVEQDCVGAPSQTSVPAALAAHLVTVQDACLGEVLRRGFEMVSESDSICCDRYLSKTHAVQGVGLYILQYGGLLLSESRMRGFAWKGGTRPQTISQSPACSRCEC